MYITKVLEKVNHNYFKIGILRVENEKEEQIGEYERSSHTRPTTFFPFQQNGKDFALYSPHYSEIRIMELPSCKDIGSDESEPKDFCSIGFYVPSYMEQEITSRRTSSEGKVEEMIWTTRVSEPKEEELTEYTKSYPYENIETNEKGKNETFYRPLTQKLYYPFGFVSGCYWMDDFTVHYLDLSEVNKGIIKRDARFGYVELIDNLPLKEAFDLQYYQKNSGERANYIRMRVMQTFDLVTGKIIEPYE